MRVPSREQLAWAAGVFVGEGSISVHRPRRHIGLRLTVGQTSDGDEPPEMLTRLQTIFGAGRLYRLRVERPHYRPHWQFSIPAFVPAQAAIAMLWEWLTPEKKRQATIALTTYHAERGARAI